MQINARSTGHLPAADPPFENKAEVETIWSKLNGGRCSFNSAAMKHRIDWQAEHRCALKTAVAELPL